MASVSTSIAVAAAVGCSASFCLKGVWLTIEELTSNNSKSQAKRSSTRNHNGRHRDVRPEQPSLISSGSDHDDAPTSLYSSGQQSPSTSRQKRGMAQRNVFRGTCMNCVCKRLSKDIESGVRGSEHLNVRTDELLDVSPSRGFTMDEARQHADADQQRAMARSPREILEILQKGNVRFWTGAATRPEKSAFERRALISKQFPSVAILGCSDSRVPVEIVFDMGLGDMFVVRVAGNCLDIGTLASLQFAVVHLQVKVLLVMGHEGCGAIRAAQKSIEDIHQEPRALAGLLGKLHAGLDRARLSNVTDARAQDREAVVTNVNRQLAELTKDAAIMSKVASKDLIVLGGMYEMSSGIVDFFGEVHETVGGAAVGEKNISPSPGLLTSFKVD